MRPTVGRSNHEAERCLPPPPPYLNHGRELLPRARAHLFYQHACAGGGVNATARLPRSRWRAFLQARRRNRILPGPSPTSTLAPSAAFLENTTPSDVRSSVFRMPYSPTCPPPGSKLPLPTSQPARAPPRQTTAASPVLPIASSSRPIKFPTTCTTVFRFQSRAS